MARQLAAHARSIAVHEVEHACGHARLFEEFCKQQTRQWRNLRGLEHRSVAHQQGWHRLEHNLVHRPVPRGDQRANTNRLKERALFGGGGQRSLKIDLGEGLKEAVHVPCACTNLIDLGQLLWRAHFTADGICHFIRACDVDFANTLHQLDPLGQRCGGPCGEGSLGGGNGCVCVGLRTQSDGFCDFLGRGVDDVHRGIGARGHPLTVDEKMLCVFHG